MNLKTHRYILLGRQTHPVNYSLQFEFEDEDSDVAWQVFLIAAATWLKDYPSGQKVMQQTGDCDFHQLRAAWFAEEHSFDCFAWCAGQLGIYNVESTLYSGSATKDANQIILPQ